MAKISNALTTYLAYKFGVLLKDPFPDWEAFKLGLIDKKGNLLKKPKTQEEKDALNSSTNLVRKIKKVFVKYIGDNKLINFIIAAYILKKEEFEEEHPAVTEVNNELDADEKETMMIVLEKMSKIEIYKGEIE
jgi:hypothetical protein